MAALRRRCRQGLILGLWRRHYGRGRVDIGGIRGGYGVVIAERVVDWLTVSPTAVKIAWDVLGVSQSFLFFDRMVLDACR